MITEITEHAEIRAQQRGLRDTDIEAVLTHGTPLGDAVMLSGKDVARSTEQLRHLIAQLERLSGTAVFLEGRRVVTVYRPQAWKRRKMREGRGPRRGAGRQARKRVEPSTAAEPGHVWEA